MLKKIAKLIFNNLGLKILAAVLAVVFWMIILNMEDPDKTKVFTVEVEIENEDYLTDMGKTYEVLNNSSTISFTATGRRSVIESLEASDFKVVADMENIVNMSQIPITITAKRYASSLDISNKTQYVEVNVENLVTESFEITAQMTGEMGTDYSVSDISISPGSVKVEGPESVVEQISSVIALVDVTSMEEDFVQESDLYFYDSDGNEISQERLTLNHSSVTATVEVLQTKTVSVSYEVVGTPPDGCRVTDVSGSITEVSVQGKKSVLSDVESITVSGGKLLVTAMTESTEVTIDLKDYLPDGVSLSSENDADVTVSIEMEQTVEESFDMPVDNIEVTNLADGLICTFDDETVAVTLEGYTSDLADFDVTDLTGSVDLDGLTEGSHSVAVELDGDYDVETVYVNLTLTGENSDVTEDAADTEEDETDAENVEEETE